MHTITPSYDVNESLSTEDYSDYDMYTPVYACSRNTDNHLGGQLSLFYFIMFGISLVGNGLVLTIIYRFEKLTVTNIFLLNLVVSDFIFMFSLPFWGIYQHLTTWVFGASMCKVVGSAYYLGYCSSILFLTLLTFDQHLTVAYPLVAPGLRRQSYAYACCAAVWLLSCLACVKHIVLYNVAPDYEGKLPGYFCEEYPTSAQADTINVPVLHTCWRFLYFFFFFLFPVAVIVYCYARITMVVVATRIVTKFRTIRIIFAIVLLFFVCWTPYNVVILMHHYVGESCALLQSLGYALQWTRNIAYLYFCISPILYSFVGKRFQKHLRELLVKSLPCLK